jgi:hypothetical protein
MKSTHRLMHVCNLVGLFLLVAAACLAPGSAAAFTFDWIQSQGPEGGQVRTLVQAPNGDLFCGLWSRGGVFRSTDQGLTWQETALAYEQVHSIVVNNAGAVIAGLTDGRVFLSVDNGASWPVSQPHLVNSAGALAYDPVLDILYAARAELISRSLDGGLSWQPLSVQFPFVQIHSMAAVPNGGPLYLGTESDHVYRSINGGTAWSVFATGLTSSGVYDLLVVPEGDIYAATWGGGIFRTEWNGTSWTQLSNGLDDPFCLAVGRDDAGNLWAGTESAGTYISSDDGLNWTAARTGIELRQIWDFLSLSGGDFLAACGGGGIFRTGDSGAIWTPSSGGMNRTTISSLLLTGTGDLFASTRGAGVHRSTDGGMTWGPVNNGIADPTVFDVVSHPDGDLFCGTWTTQIYQSSNGGNSWSPTGSAPNMERVNCMAVNPTTGELYAGAIFSGGVWRSPDKGATWIQANGGLPNFMVSGIVVEDDGNLLVGVDGGGVYRSEDNGASWTDLNNGLPSLFVSDILSTPGGVLFAAIPYFRLHRSLDNGANWESVDPSLFDSRINTIAVNTSGALFAGASAGGLVFESVDGGDSWFSISSGFSHVSVLKLGFNEFTNLLAGTDGFGVYLTDEPTPVFTLEFIAERNDDGSVTVTWIFPSDVSYLSAEVYRSVDGAAREMLPSGVLIGGPDFQIVDESAPSEPCDYWLLLTDSSGTQSWYGPVSTNKIDLLMPGLSIEAVWPNPAPNSTTIRYSVPGNQTATLDVYDLAGRRVRRLRQDTGGAGTLEAVWDARDDRGTRVASGTYFLRLQTENRMVTGKVVVLGDRR